MIGAPDNVEPRPAAGTVTVYAADEDHDYRTGEVAMLAAHLDGVPADMIDAVVDALR